MVLSRMLLDDVDPRQRFVDHRLRGSGDISRWIIDPTDPDRSLDHDILARPVSVLRYVATA